MTGLGSTIEPRGSGIRVSKVTVRLLAVAVTRVIVPARKALVMPGSAEIVARIALAEIATPAGTETRKASAGIATAAGTATQQRTAALVTAQALAGRT